MQRESAVAARSSSSSRICSGLTSRRGAHSTSWSARCRPRTLLIVSYRPEYDDGWLGRPNYTRLHVDPLTPAIAQDLLATLLGGAVGARAAHASV